MAAHPKKTVYVALLRGINVGGNNKINMKALAACFENRGLEQVRTYINSGNVIFASGREHPETLSRKIEAAILEDFGLQITVLLRDLDQMTAICGALPASWVKNQTMRADVMFLAAEIDSPEILEPLSVKPADEVKYVPGALLWKIHDKDYNQSGMAKLASKAIYKNMTVRNVNTVRKIYELMREVTA